MMQYLKFFACVLLFAWVALACGILAFGLFRFLTGL